MTTDLDVVVIGAGISGIGAAIRLQQIGVRDFVVLEKADRLGGTWRDNTYPGCACDVPSSLYSYSFAQRSDWSRAFAAQPEILDYVNATAERFGVLPFVRFESPVEEATWNESRARWVVRTPRETFHARVLISCAGYLHEPQIPDVPGLADFPGTLFHSSRWNHAHRLEGERVAVIGTGASAIQFVPAIAPRVAALHVYQRTPQWILPKPDVAIPAPVRHALALPNAKQRVRDSLDRVFEGLGAGFRHPEYLERAQWLARRHLERAVRDPALRAKLLPDYVLGCKRVLLSNDYYPTFTRSNVELLATGVRRVDGRVVVGQDGEAREVDTIILGTGFHVSDPRIAERIRGTDGRTLAEIWDGSPEAYRGTTIAGFPNAFLVLGPNLAIGHNSAFIVIEAQLDYAMSAITTMRREGLTRVEVERAAQAAYNERVQRDLARTVWNVGGCASYYIDRNGRNSIGFPWSTYRMRELLARFDRESYSLRADAAAQEAEVSRAS